MLPGLAPRSNSSVVTAAPSSLRGKQGSRPGPFRGLWSCVLGVLEWRAIGLQSTPSPAQPSLRLDPHAPMSNRGLEVVIEVAMLVVIAAC